MSGVSQTLWKPLRHHSHVPSPWLKGTSTRSPFFQRVTSGPTSSTTPQNSWPSTHGACSAPPTPLLDHDAERVAEHPRRLQRDPHPRPVPRPQVPVGPADPVGLDADDRS